MNIDFIYVRTNVTWMSILQKLFFNEYIYLAANETRDKWGMRKQEKFLHHFDVK